MNVRRLISYFLYSLFFIAASSYGTELDVETIVQKANLAAFYGGNDGRAETRMTIVDAQGRKQLRQFTILRKNIEKGGDQQFMVFFSRPSDVKRTMFMVEKHPGADDDRWLYLPSLDLVKRIAAGDKRTSFVGSNFYYEDISGRGLEEDVHTLVGDDDEYFEIRNVPKDAGSVEFSEYTVWVDKSTFMPIKTEYKDDTGKVYRRIEALKIESINGIPTATRMKVSDLRTGGYTVNEMRFIAYDVGLPSTIFSERSLRNPPKKWLSRPKKSS